MEWVLLNLLRPQVHHAQEPHQFAYRANVGVDDAILLVLHWAHLHLDKGGSTVRILFLDFQSAFNSPLAPGKTDKDASGTLPVVLDLQLSH